MRCLIRGLLFTLAVATASLAASQPQTGPQSGPHISARLVAETNNPAPASTTSIAIAMTPAAHWHGYWSNGGDAGFGMQVRWTLPRGVTIGEIAYPVPDTLVIAGLMNHVFERPYALIAPLMIDSSVAPGTLLTISGEATWLACTTEICVPERGTLTINLIVGSGSTAPSQRAQFDRWRSLLPQPISAIVRYQMVGRQLRIAIPLPAPLVIVDPHLFVDTARINQPGGEQRFSRVGEVLVIETVAGDDAANARQFSGLLRLGGTRGLSFVAVPGDVPATGTPFAVTSAAAPDAPEAAAAAAAAAASSSFDLAAFAYTLFGAILGGLILNIMPCVFPILSLKALTLARAGGDERSVRAEGFAYTAGAVFTCMALGAILLLLRSGGEALGWAFQLQRPESVVLLIILMAAIAANLAGLFAFGNLSLDSVSVKLKRSVPAHSPSRPPTTVYLMGGREGEWAGADSTIVDQTLAPALGEGSDAKSSFATGALAAFIATPCTGPFLGAALGATLTLPPWAALPIFGGLGLGLALPFLALAMVPALRSRLPRPGAWMVTFQRWLALPMLLTALALIWLLSRQVGNMGWLIGVNALLATLLLGWWAGRLQKHGKQASIAIFAMAAMIVPLALALPDSDARRDNAAPQSPNGADGARPWSGSSLAAALDAGQPVFVYFTADWCVTCKVNEASSITSDATAASFAAANVTVLVADWTSADPAITAELARHGRNSVPLYLWYPAGSRDPEVLPQILTPSMLIDRAGRSDASR